MAKEDGKHGNLLQITLYEENAVDWKKQLVWLLNYTEPIEIKREPWWRHTVKS